MYKYLGFLRIVTCKKNNAKQMLKAALTVADFLSAFQSNSASSLLSPLPPKLGNSYTDTTIFSKPAMR